MPNESKPERNECDAPETTPRNAPEAVVSAVAQSQGINPTADSGGTLEKRLESIVGGPPAGVNLTPESELLRSQIKAEIAGVKPGTPVDRYLKGNQSEQQAVVEKLVDESMSGSPDAVGALEDLSTIKKLECLGHLARSMGGKDPNSKRDRFDSLLTLSHMERGDGETGGFAAQVLNQLFEKGPLSVQTEIITSRGVADIEQNHLQERSSNLLQDLFSGGGMEPLLKLEAYNRSRLLQGYGGLKDLTVFARDFQQNRGTFQDGASDLENLSKLSEKSAVTRKLMDELVIAGVLNFDKSTGLYSSASNSEFNPAALWNVRYAANADSRDGHGQKSDYRTSAESDEIRAFRTLLDRELSGESTEQGAGPNNNRSDSSVPSDSVVLSEDELQAQLDLIGLYASKLKQNPFDVVRLPESEAQYERVVKLDSGVVCEFDQKKPPHLVSITNTDGTFARFDEQERVLECKGKDGELRSFTYEGDRRTGFSDRRGKWSLQADEAGKDFFQHTTSKEKFYGELSVGAAVNAATCEVLLTFRDHNNVTGDSKTIFPDGSKEIAGDSCSKLYNSDGKLVVSSNLTTGESFHYKWHPPGHAQAGRLAKITKPDGSTWTPTKDAKVWKSDRSGKFQGTIDVNEATGQHHYKAKNGDETYWYPDKPADILKHAEIHASARGLYDYLNSKWGVDVDGFEKILENKTLKQRQAIENEYKDITGGRSVFNDVGVRLAGVISGRDPEKMRAINALRRPDNEHADYAGALALAYTNYQAATFKADATNEIRSLLFSRSSQELEAIRKEFPERRKLAGVDGQVSLDQAIASLYQPDREACQILAKGADKLKYEDFEKLSEIALRKPNLDMFLETWKMAGPKERETYLKLPTTESAIYKAFPLIADDLVSKKGMGIEAGKALDVLKHGFVGADKLVRESSTYLYGDFEEHIDLAIRTMSQPERDLFIAGEKIHASNPDGKDLLPDAQLAYDRYKAIHGALTRAGYEYEVHRWEDRLVRGGSLITELADLNGFVYDATTDRVMKTIEDMSVADFERLRTDDNYRAKVEAVLKSFADGAPDDPTSELGRCLALVDRKCRIESDTARMKPGERAKYERGKEILVSGQLTTLSKEQSQSLETYIRLGKDADATRLSAEQKQRWDEGKRLSADIEARDFYRQRVFASSEIRAKRSVFEVIDDNERYYGNSTANVLAALSNLRPNEKKMLERARDVADSTVDLSKLTAGERAKYEDAVEFRRKLDTRLEEVLDQGIKLISSVGSAKPPLAEWLPCSAISPLGNLVSSAGAYKDFAHSFTSERDVAKAILGRVTAGDSGKQDIVDKLNIYASQIRPDKAQIALDISKALRENPELARVAKTVAEAYQSGTLPEALSQMPAAERAVAVRLTDAMRKALGSSLYDEQGMRLLSGSFSAADQLYLRTVDNVWNDKQGMLRDLESFSAKDDETLAAFLSDASLEKFLIGKSAGEANELTRQAVQFMTVFDGLTNYEKAIFKNGLKSGLQPEDWLRQHFGDDFDGTHEEGIKNVFAKLTDRSAMRDELSQRPEFKGVAISELMVTQAVNRKLEQVFNSYASKYGENLTSKLIREVGGEDLQNTMRLARKHSENADDTVFRDQQEFFKSLGLGSDFVDFMGYGASTSIGKNAFDNTIVGQAYERRGIAPFSNQRARELAEQLSEASRTMDSTQSELSDTAIDVAINVACILATVPSGGTSLIALAGNLGGKTGAFLKTVGTVLQAMEKAGKISQVATRTEFLANWFSKASKAEQMIALGITGGAGKVGFKSTFGGKYDLATNGPRDFISGFTDMALNADIPLGKWSRTAAGRTFGEVSESLTRRSAQTAGGAALELSERALVPNFKGLMEKGVNDLADAGLSASGKLDDKAVATLAESLVKEGLPNRDQLVKELSEKLQKSLTENVNQDLSMTQAVLEAMYASRQGVLAGAASSAAYADPHAGIEQNLVSVAVGAGAGGVMNFAMALPLEMAGRALRKVAPKAPDVDADGSVHVRFKPRPEAKASSSGDNLGVLTDTDRKVHDVSERMTRLEAKRSKMSLADIATEEKMIAGQKSQIVNELQEEARLHLTRKLGLTDLEASEICRNLKIDIADFDVEAGTNGVMHQDSGHIELRMGKGLPKDRSITQTFMHEFEHLINHSRNTMFLKENPQHAVNAIIDDCLKGVLTGTQRLEDVPGAESAADMVGNRLHAQQLGLSWQDVNFVKQQLKDYLGQQDTEGKLGKPLSAADLKFWMESRKPPARFANPDNESILLKEMVSEIFNANQVLSSARMTEGGALDSAVQSIMVALKRTHYEDAVKFKLKGRDDASAFKHYFAGVADSTMGAAGVDGVYKFASTEEMAANRLPLYRIYEASGRELTDRVKGLSVKLAEGVPVSDAAKSLVGQLKDVVDRIDRQKLDSDLARAKGKIDFQGDAELLAKELNTIDFKERKAVRKLEQELATTLRDNANVGALDELRDSPRLGNQAKTVLDAVAARETSVQKLRELTAIEQLAGAARESRSATVSADRPTSEAAQRKLDAALSNLVENCRETTLSKVVAYIEREGIATPETLIKLVPAEKLGVVVKSLTESGVSVETILAAMKPDPTQPRLGSDTAWKRADAAVEGLLKGRTAKDLLYSMLFAGGHIQEAAIKALKNPGPELRFGLDFKIVFLLSRAETEGKLNQAVELLSERARMSQSAITENLTPSMEGKVRAVLAEVEAANMKKVGTTPEVVRAAFEEFSVPPEKLAVSLLQKEGVRVLAIGEVHGLNSPHRNFVSSMMDDLKTAGATHIAVELPTSMQADLNEALKIASGTPADIKPLQNLIRSFNADATMGDKSFIDLLVSARKAGLEVVAVDGPMADFEGRDKVMADTIQGILNGNEHHKVVFFAGAEHTALDTPNSSGKTPSAVQLLGASGILAKTIVEQDGRSINAALKHIGQTLATPSGVYTWGIAGLDSLPLSLDIIRGRRLENWDSAIVYPSP